MNLIHISYQLIFDINKYSKPINYTFIYQLIILYHLVIYCRINISSQLGIHLCPFILQQLFISSFQFIIHFCSKLLCIIHLVSTSNLLTTFNLISLNTVHQLLTSFMTIYYIVSYLSKLHIIIFTLICLICMHLLDNLIKRFYSRIDR